MRSIGQHHHFHNRSSYFTHGFHSIDDVGWYAGWAFSFSSINFEARFWKDIHRFSNRIYPLTSCALQPSFGKIYRLFSNKPVFLGALSVFETGSIVCATAPTSHVFILGWASAGLGSAGIQAGTTLILADCVPVRQRPIWNSIIGSLFAVGSVAGPLVVFSILLSKQSLK